MVPRLGGVATIPAVRSLLFLLCLAAAPATRPAAVVPDRDPAVFRCVLDGNARTVVVSLGNQRWAAYDAATCALAKVWHGDVNLTGPVYDYKHGPQPEAQGKVLYDTRGQVPLDGPRLKYAGYALDRDGRPTFRYLGDGFEVRETPTLRVEGDATVLVRDVRVTGGHTVILFPSAGETRVGEHLMGRASQGGLTLGEGDRLDSAKHCSGFVHFTPPPDAEGRIVLETRFDAAPAN